MPTSVPGNKYPVARGFTLVELMVVLVVMGLAVGAAALALPDARGALRQDAARFGARVRAAHDAAIVEARPTSVWVTPSGYGFDARRGGRWVPTGDRTLSVQQWSKGVVALTGPRTRLVFDTTGLADPPIGLTLRRDGRNVAIAVAADGSVTVDG